MSSVTGLLGQAARCSVCPQLAYLIIIELQVSSFRFVVSFAYEPVVSNF